MAEEEKKADEQPVSGEVVVCGATDWRAIGRTKDVRADLYPNLQSPHRVKVLESIRIAFIASGSSACHTVALDVGGAAYSWGRNDKGQLGLGDQITHVTPTLIPGLRGKVVVAATCGKSHTAVATKDGEAWSFGLNDKGQLGPIHIVEVSAGVEFTCWLDRGGALFTAGSQQYGQTGHGTDGSYNAADSSVKIQYESLHTPRRVLGLRDKRVTRVASGHNHSVAVASDGGVWTWGNGGYGRLGHRVQQDEHRPRLVEALAGRVTVKPDAVIAAGGTSTFCVTSAGSQLFAWGKLKPSGENLMYPTPYMELAGWTIRSLACGYTTFAAAAEADGACSVITWGHSNGYSELGYGPGGKKSSSNPDKCYALEKTDARMVAAGFGHTVFLVDPDSAVTKALPVWDAPAIDEDSLVSVGGAKGAKTGAAGAAGKKKAAPVRGGVKKATGRR